MTSGQLELAVIRAVCVCKHPWVCYGLGLFKKVLILITLFVLSTRATMEVWLEQRENKEQERTKNYSIKAKSSKTAGLRREENTEKGCKGQTLSKKNTRTNTENIRQCWNWFDYSQRWQLLSPRRWRENLFSAPSGGMTQTQKLTKPRRETVQDSH